MHQLQNLKNIKPEYLKASVYGASDGIVTTFAVVAGVVGAGLSLKTIMILGIANMMADGFSMAVGDYLGERSSLKLKISRGQKVEEQQLWITSVITFVSFVIAGTLPLLPYSVVFFGVDFPAEKQFLASIIATLSAMFFVGSLRTFVTKGVWWKNGLEMLLVGSLAAFVAYFLGAFLENIVR